MYLVETGNQVSCNWAGTHDAEAPTASEESGYFVPMAQQWMSLSTAFTCWTTGQI